MSRIKILHITSTGLGGVGLNILLLSKYLDRNRFELCVSAPPDPDFTVPLEKEGVLVHPISIDRKPMRSSNLNGFAQLLSLMRKESFDIVHTHTAVGGVVGRLAARLSGVPAVVWTIHGWTFNYPYGKIKKGVYKGVERFLDRFTDQYIAVSQDMKQVGVKANIASEAKIEVIEHGIQKPPNRGKPGPSALRKSLNISPEAPVVGFVGRLEPQKAPEVFLHTADIVAKRSPGVTFLVVGDGPLMGKMRTQCDHLGLTDKVRFVGWQDNVIPYLMTMDVLCMPSLWESFGILLLEAMAVKKPVVASRIGGIPEVVVDGDTGHLVPTGNPAATADALLELLGDRRAAREMGEAGFRRFQDRFSVERMIPRYEDFYQRLYDGSNIRV